MMILKFSLALCMVFSSHVAIEQPRLTQAQTVGVQSITGDWQGTLHLPNEQDQRVIFQIRQGADGKLSTTVMVLSANTQRLVADQTMLENGKLIFSLQRIDVKFEGRVAPDGKSIMGNLKLGQSLPLVLERANAETAWSIPKPPKVVDPMDPTADPTFDIVTVKPTAPGERGKLFRRLPNGGFSTLNTSLLELLTFTLHVSENQLVGLPDWAHTEYWDVTAKSDTPGLANDKQLTSMMKKLLAERFGLKYHAEKRDMVAYRMTVDKGGVKMKLSTAATGVGKGLFFTGPGKLSVTNATMDDFAGMLQSALLDHPVIDETGLGEKKWDFLLRWQLTDDEAVHMGMQKAPPPRVDEEVAPPLLVAIPEELGIHIDSRKMPVDTIVIDHIDKPSAN